MKIKIMRVYSNNVKHYIEVLNKYNLEINKFDEYFIELNTIEDISNLIREIDTVYNINSIIIETDDYHGKEKIDKNYRIVIYDDYYE